MTDHQQVGTLTSVNVGTPRDISWHGQLVRTAIDKHAVPGTVAVRRLNVDGDGQADLVGHGGEHRAVFVYQRDSYRYWSHHLSRDLNRPGLFGENFTVTGLSDDDTCIGDRLRIGTAEFEVTQPRVTCFKVGIALAEPRMPALLTGHGRPGFYLRVLCEGTVRVGDRVTRLEHVDGALTVRQTSDLLYRSQHDPDLLHRSIDTPALPEGWRASFRALLDTDPATGNAGLTAAVTEPAWTGFRTFRVESLRAEAPVVRSLILAPTDGVPLTQHRPGQFVTLRIGPEALIRSYTLSAPSDPERLRITVRRLGPGSSRLHELAVGDSIEVAAPRGTFTLPDDPDIPLLLASAGVGVTPMIAMLAELAAQQTDRPVTWLHVARSHGEHVLADDAQRLLTHLPNSRTRIHYTAARASMPRSVQLGRPTARDVQALGLDPHTHAYLCGPDGFMNDLRAGLADLGLPSDQIHTETFGAARRAQPARATSGDAPGVAVPVTFARTGLTVDWTPQRGSLLDLAEEAGVPVSWSCRSGVCHRCQSGLVSGDITYNPTPLDEPPHGTLLLCSATPRTGVVLDL